MAVAIARLGNSALRWVVFAGGSWGLTMATGFLAINVPQCGLPCPADVLTMTAICVALACSRSDHLLPSQRGADTR